MILKYVGSSILAIYIHDLLHELRDSRNDSMMWPPMSP